MTKKLIFIEDHRNQLHCDNPACGYDLPEGIVTWGPHLIGYECPKCASNMLTERDYADSEKMFRIIAWLNKWFGWLGKEAPDSDYDTISVRHHNGHVHLND